MSRIRVCLKLWVPVDSRNDSGMVEAVEGLLGSLPELVESAVGNRNSELLPGYRSAGIIWFRKNGCYRSVRDSMHKAPELPRASP